MTNNNENRNSENRDAIEFLILNHGLEVSGIDSETGEILYSFTPKIKELMPELYNEHVNHVNSEIMRLWEKGFVNLDLFSDEPIVTLTAKAFDKESLATLSKKDIWALQEMKRLLKKRNF